ncbi:MAG: alpha/beta fold hydrolase [Acidimicrobiaceae bacterium]|nr:alpha/beta fold hydrolase [Acidimicrobiaceae bacterium]
MPTASANELMIEYETFGDANCAPVLLIAGLGDQLTAWDEDLCRALARDDFYVIRYDNRDAGGSTWFDDAGEPDVAELLAGTVALPYSMADMATDAARLLDALGLASAHVVGVSMGAMIAQTFAISYSERTRTLTSIMGSTGDPRIGQPHPDALGILLAPAPTTRDEAIAQGVTASRVLGSPGFPLDEGLTRDQAGAAYDRAFHPSGEVRQMAAIIFQEDRTAKLAEVSAATLVIHGEADRLVDPSGGEATAAAIPGARLKLVAGLGHDLPSGYLDELVTDLGQHFRQRV